MAALSSEEMQEFFLDDDSDDSEDELDGISYRTVDGIVDEFDTDSGEEDVRLSKGYSHNWLMEFTETAGPSNITDDMSEVDYFLLFFNDEIFDLLVRETNRYAQQVRQKTPDTYHVKTWRDVPQGEMKAFVCLLLLSGLTKRSSHELYWSTDPLMEMPGFRKVMSRNRFLNILSFLHLSNNDEALPNAHPNHSKAYKIYAFYKKLISLWQRYFIPNKEVSVNESVIPFKGHINPMLCVPTKLRKSGLKAWGLTDSKTGYIYNWEMYLGKDNQHSAHGWSHHIVTSLVCKLYNKGHVVYMDNFLSSSTLFHELAHNEMAACGTFRINSQGVPDNIKRAKPKAEEPLVTARDGHILYISWLDKQPVNLMTTAHSSETFVKTVRLKRHSENVHEMHKPVALQEYSRHMRGVYRTDQVMTYYMIPHRSCKWWKKVFFYLMEVCFSNSLVIYKQQQKERISADKFRLAICHGLLQGYEPVCFRPSIDKPFRRTSSNGHSPALNPKRLSNGGLSKPDCVVCSDRNKKRHQTQYICKLCREPMCPYPCFDRWHSLVDYRIECTKSIHHE